MILVLANIKPYLKTTTSKLVENTKAFELTIIKEHGFYLLEEIGVK
jgi:hypothetical protein